MYGQYQYLLSIPFEQSIKQHWSQARKQRISFESSEKKGTRISSKSKTRKDFTVKKRERNEKRTKKKDVNFRKVTKIK